MRQTTAFTSAATEHMPPSEVSISSGEEGSWSYFESKYIFNEDQEELKQTSPERVMFIAVFLQSLLDATKPENEG